MATQYFAYTKMLVTKGYRKLKCSDMKLLFVVFVNTYWRRISTLKAGAHLIEYVAMKLDKFYNRKANTSSFTSQIIPWCCKFGHFINFQLLCCWRLWSGLNGEFVRNSSSTLKYKSSSNYRNTMRPIKGYSNIAVDLDKCIALFLDLKCYVHKKYEYHM